MRTAQGNRRTPRKQRMRHPTPPWGRLATMYSVRPASLGAGDRALRMTPGIGGPMASNTSLGSFAKSLPTIFRELVHGSPDPSARTYVLNQGDRGLLASLDRPSAADASRTHAGGSSIAAHVDHLRYGLSLLNPWGDRVSPPWPEMDWTASWRRTVVSDSDWRTLLEELRHEATRWAEALSTSRDVSDVEAAWLAGSVAHLAYHMGAIRQIDSSTRGPTAEDEAAHRGGS